MKIAVVYLSLRPETRLKNLALALAAGMRSQGFEVDCLDGLHGENPRLTMYRYLAIGTEAVSWLGRISERVAEFLASCGSLEGKRSFAFVKRTPFGHQKALLNLMNAMEKEGMLVCFSEALASPEQALQLGKRLHILD